MAGNLKILIGEDEAIIAQCLKTELEHAGIIVNGIYSNGKDCINAVKEMDISVLLLDVNLNGTLDGF